MKIVLGPILHVVDCSAATWRFRVVVHTAAGSTAKPAADALEFESDDVVVSEAAPIADLSEYGLGRSWGWSVEAPRRDDERRLKYVLRHDGGELRVDHVFVPARTRLPRIAYTSCSGFSDGAIDPQAKKQPFELWKRMKNLHERTTSRDPTRNPSGFHLLIGGGDQIYQDGVVIDVDGRRKTVEDIVADRPAVQAATFLRAARRAYAAHYVQHFAIPEMAAMFARLPALRTWDDHELFDGCGSHRPDVQDHPTVRLLRRAARDTFVVFQLGADPDAAEIASVHPPEAAGGDDPDSSHFLQWACFEAEDAELDFLVLDLRSGRTMTRVLSPAQWDALDRALRGIESRTMPRKRHVLLVSSIPVVHARHSRLLAMRPALPEKLGLADDLLDQWEHSLHREEQLRLIDRLFRAQAAGCRVTILSGDVHSGTALRIESERAEHRSKGVRIPILQITSSGIVHPPPPVDHVRILEHFVKAKEEELADGLTTRFAIALSDVKSIFEPNYASIHFEPRRENEFSFAGRAWIERKKLGPLGPISFSA